MSGKKFSDELEDKYANKAVSFKSEIAQYGKQTEFVDDKQRKNVGLEHLSSDVKEKKDIAEAIKPDGYIKRKTKRIFGALGDFKTMFI